MKTAATEPAGAGTPAPENREGGPFSYSIFRNIWVANLAANFGKLIQAVGASWLMVSLTPSPVMVALVQSSTTLPLFMLSLFAGALADSFDRRRVMLFAQVMIMLVSIALAVATFLGWITPWTLLIFTFLIGCGTALNAPTWQAAVGDMVPRKVLADAVTINSVGFNIARSIGPAIGGMLVAAAGAVAAFAVNAVSYTGIVTVLARWKYRRVPDAIPREPMREAMASGVRYVLMSPEQIAVLARGFFYGLGAITMGALMPLVAHDFLKGTATTYGILLAFFGIGSVTGALPINRLRRRLGNERLIQIFIVVTAIGLVITGLSRSMPITILGVMCGGLGWISVLSTFNVTIQLSSPRWVVARSVSIYQMLTFGGMAFGGWMAGYIAQVTSLEAAFLIGAAIEGVAFLLGFVLPLPETDALDLEPLNRYHAPKTALDIAPHEGPVMISIAYDISDADTARFLALMHERRRIRRRDGATRWSLQRDLADPDRWFERFRHPSWLSYARQLERRTRADLGNWEEIMALHRGGNPPDVERTIVRATDSRAATGGLPLDGLPHI